MTKANQKAVAKQLLHIFTGDDAITPTDFYIAQAQEYIAFTGTHYYWDLSEAEKEKRARMVMLRLEAFQLLMATYRGDIRTLFHMRGAWNCYKNGKFFNVALNEAGQEEAERIFSKWVAE